MWLLDANMDVHLTGLLSEYGIRCEPATRRGWASLDNGELVGVATKAGFTCVLTRDRLFADSAGYAAGNRRWRIRKKPAATAPETGIVRTHAQMMFLATPQRTALKRWMLPTPMIPPAMV